MATPLTHTVEKRLHVRHQYDKSMKRKKAWCLEMPYSLMDIDATMVKGTHVCHAVTVPRLMLQCLPSIKSVLYPDLPTSWNTNFLQRHGYMDDLPSHINSYIFLKLSSSLCTELHLLLQDAAKRYNYQVAKRATNEQVIHCTSPTSDQNAL